MNMKNLEEKLAIKELVDVFSIMADDKDAEGQKNLFTDNAVVKSYFKGELISELVGKENIGNGFGAYLDLFDTVYHLNGQQMATIDGDIANGTSYCQVVLIGEENGKRIRTLQGVRYKDKYIKEEGRWLISERNSEFMWREVMEINE